LHPLAHHLRSVHTLRSSDLIPLPMTSKIPKLLAKEGLFVSRRGVNGDYALARPAREMTLASILATLEGGVALTQCAEHPSTRNRSEEHTSELQSRENLVCRL